VNRLFNAITKSLKAHAKSHCDKNLYIKNVVKDIADPCRAAYLQDPLLTQIAFAMCMLKLLPVVVCLNRFCDYSDNELWCLESIKESIGGKKTKDIINTKLGKTKTCRIDI
jgi:hypothetical protein